MDVEMKFMDGMSAAEEIRKADTEVVIIFICLLYTSRFIQKVILIMQEEPFLPGIARTVN